MEQPKLKEGAKALWHSRVDALGLAPAATPAKSKLEYIHMGWKLMRWQKNGRRMATWAFSFGVFHGSIFPMSWFWDAVRYRQDHCCNRFAEHLWSSGYDVSLTR